MFRKYETEIAVRAIERVPQEAVWFITTKGLIEVANVHPDPENFFEVSAEDSFRAHKDGLLAVVHSHPGRCATPSEADMRSQIRTAVPWGIVAVNHGQASEFVWWGGDLGRAKLLGRPFLHGVSDCYALVRDFYHAYGIEIPEVPRDWQWWEAEEKFSQHWPDFGFEMVEVNKAQKGDVWLSQIRTSFENHCGIMLNSDTTLHHPGSDDSIDHSRLSIVQPIYRYLPYVTKMLRHKDSEKFLEREVQL